METNKTPSKEESTANYTDRISEENHKVREFLKNYPSEAKAYIRSINDALLRQIIIDYSDEQNKALIAERDSYKALLDEMATMLKHSDGALGFSGYLAGSDIRKNISELLEKYNKLKTE